MRIHSHYLSEEMDTSPSLLFSLSIFFIRNEVVVSNGEVCKTMVFLRLWYGTCLEVVVRYRYMR
jgi:hypothetical protein